MSFTHPHDPYVARPAFWDLYADCPALDPETAADPLRGPGPHDQRLMQAADFTASEITPEDVRRSRRAYFANISYIDARIGELLAVLDACGMSETTAILFTSDHGDMLGERGLWFKMSFRDPAARVPLILAAPGLAPARIDTPVSLLDVLPTLADLAGADTAGLPCDGTSLLPVAAGDARGPVPMEYAAEGSTAPMVALRDGRWKLTVSATPPRPSTTSRPTPTRPPTSPPTPPTPPPSPACSPRSAPAGTSPPSTAPSAPARPAAASSTTPCARAPTRRGTTSPTARQAERFMRNHMDLNVLECRQRFPRP